MTVSQTRVHMVSALMRLEATDVYVVCRTPVQTVPHCLIRAFLTRVSTMLSVFLVQRTARSHADVRQDIQVAVKL